MSFLMTLKKMFPSGWPSCFFKILLDKNGTTVKETNKEAKMEEMTAIGRLLIKSPEESGRNTRGMKATINVMVQPKTAMPIWFVAFKVASNLVWPSRIQRSIFSTTTILSSTNNPKATTKPTILNWFRL